MILIILLVLEAQKEVHNNPGIFFLSFFLKQTSILQADAQFFYLSAIDLTSKLVGKGEKIIEETFNCALSKENSIIFLDDIDYIA
ncbi:MAG: hypothetical protein EZS28_047327, partial [Streblomastix strix]